jgi:hypothetical protein
MIFKKFKPFLAPKVFQFRDPDTQKEFTGTSIKDVATQVNGYRAQNELEPLEYIEAVIENYLCHLPLHAGSCTPVTNAKRTVGQWTKGGIALLQNLMFKDFAPQDQADKRSEICANCPHNSFPDKNYYITWSDMMAEKSVGQLKSKHHDKLGTCDICGCILKSKVFWKGRVKLSPDELQKMKKVPNCWQPPLVNINAK